MTEEERLESDHQDTLDMFENALGINCEWDWMECDFYQPKDTLV